jgi:hypothetical protein
MTTLDDMINISYDSVQSDLGEFTFDEVLTATNFLFPSDSCLREEIFVYQNSNGNKKQLT